MVSSRELAVFSSAAPSAGLLVIDLDAVRFNYRLLRGLLQGAACGGVVKADAYGLGAAKVAPVLAAEGCRHFFVAHLDEALALLPHLPDDATTYVLNGLTRNGTDEAACLVVAGKAVAPVLNSVDQLAVWRGKAAQSGRVLPAAVQVDTGMSRLGLPPEDIKAVAADADAFIGLDVHFVMSHLACADEPRNPASTGQLANFRTARAALGQHPALARSRSCFANSSGIFLGADYHFDLVRPGAALYGINPLPGRDNPLRGVASLFGRIIQTRWIPAGTHVGYGYTAMAARPTRVATLSVGYADGWLRSLSGKGAVWLGDDRLPILGRVSMDSICVDATDIAEERLAPDTPVELIGIHQDVDDVADAASTIGYEVLTSLGSRYRREYLGG